MAALLWGLAFATVSACLVAPFAEEIVYRGVLLRSLANRFGVLAGAVVFSGTRGLSTVIALHCLYNLAVKLPEWFIYHAGLH